MRKIVIFFGLIIILSSCTQIRTKQFLIPKDEEGKEPVAREVGGWTFLNPKFEAYKNMNSEKVKQQNSFWLTLQAQYENKHKDQVAGDFTIDSVVIYSTLEDSNYVTFPTRESEFDSNTGKYHIKVFNFFEDQGIEFKVFTDTLKVAKEDLEEIKKILDTSIYYIDQGVVLCKKITDTVVISFDVNFVDTDLPEKRVRLEYLMKYDYRNIASPMSPR